MRVISQVITLCIMGDVGPEIPGIALWDACERKIIPVHEVK